MDLRVRRARRRQCRRACRRREAPCRRERRHSALARPARNSQAQLDCARSAVRFRRERSMNNALNNKLSARLARVPCTIVTGFLGAGKTTLIRHVLANAQGRRLAIIVNEFGDVGIDGEILKGCGNAICPEENIVELANGCLSCTVADEFVPALDAILAKDGVDHIVIETSGLALPKPLAQTFHWPAIKSRVTVDGVGGVVDGAALAGGRVAADLEALKRQRAADTALAHDDPVEEVFED